MKIKDALEKRIPRVRDLNWPDKTYVRLPLTKDGHGPWAEVFDLSITADGKPERQLVSEAFLEMDCEPYTGDPHQAEENGYSKIYEES